MYNTVGYYVRDSGTIRCDDCIRAYLESEHGIKTDTEKDFILSDSFTRLVDEWPVHVTVDGYTYDYIYDEDGDIIMATQVYVDKEDRVMDIKETITTVTDGEEWEDGLYCDCGEELIEESTETCYSCKNIIAHGSEQLRTLSKEFPRYESHLCKVCYEEMTESAIDDITQKMNDAKQTVTPLIAYQIDDLLHMLEGTTRFDYVYAWLGKNCTLFDTENNTALGLFNNAIEEVLENNEYEELMYTPLYTVIDTTNLYIEEEEKENTHT